MHLLRWQHMMLPVLHAIDPGPATLFTEYEAVATDPPGQARRLAAFLDRQFAMPAATAPLPEWLASACPPCGATNTGSAKRNR